VGLDLRWKAALRDLQVQLERLMGWFPIPGGTGLQSMQSTIHPKNETNKNDNSTNKKFD